MIDVVSEAENQNESGNSFVTLCFCPHRKSEGKQLAKGVERMTKAKCLAQAVMATKGLQAT